MPGNQQNRQGTENLGSSAKIHFEDVSTAGQTKTPSVQALYQIPALLWMPQSAVGGSEQPLPA